MIEKRWERADGEWLGGPPLDIPADWAITVTSELETVTCTTGLGGLSCTDGGDGVSVPPGGSYTVVESGLPAGFAAHSGVGTFATTLDSQGAACIPGDPETPRCTHTVVNRATGETVPGDPEAPHPDDLTTGGTTPEPDDPVDQAGAFEGDASSTTLALAPPTEATTAPPTTAAALAAILPATGASPTALLTLGTMLVATGFGAAAGSRRLPL